MTTSEIFLNDCDREPIHIPGTIQRHGYLVAVNRHSFIIDYISENLPILVGMPLQQLLGKHFTKLLDSGVIVLKSPHLSQLEDLAQEDDEKLAPLHVKINEEAYFLLAHRSGNHIIIEFEEADLKLELELQQVLGVSVSQILEGGNISKTLQNASKKIKEIIGYERVMIYRFAEDGHGEVIAEEKDDHLEAYFGLHYPAADIPKQARELYKINLTRIIADVSSQPVRIIAEDKEKRGIPLDLTHANLRAVSPAHIEYLKNMGVMASFSISILINGELWGLIACHHSKPLFINFKAREATKLIGQILATAIEFKIEEENKRLVTQFTNSTVALLKAFRQEENITQSLAGNIENLLRATNAAGVIACFNNQFHMQGNVPAVDDVKAIVNWIRENVRQQLFYTHSLPIMYSPAKDFADKASGIMYCEISRELDEYIIWFKPELSKTVNWAGDPGKAMTQDAGGLTKISPRASFAVWTEQVKMNSLPWKTAEVISVTKLREDIIQSINIKANQIRMMNEKLREAYDELDTFSFTISHDLKTPLTAVKSYAEILEEDNELNDQARMMVQRIIRGADKMNMLINEVLEYSRIGRMQITKERIPMAAVLSDIINDIRIAFRDREITIITDPVIDVDGDKTMVSQVFSNILSNAVKYSSKEQRSEVRVVAKELPNEVLYAITDNGIGIDMQHSNQVFEIFRRMSNATAFEGTGVGLSIAKRIMEKHMGKIWFESETGKGTTFYLLFPAKQTEGLNNDQ